MLSDWHVRAIQSAVDGKWFATAHSGAQVGVTALGTPRWARWAYTGHHVTHVGVLVALEQQLTGL